MTVAIGLLALVCLGGTTGKVRASNVGGQLSGFSGCLICGAQKEKHHVASGPTRCWTGQALGACQRMPTNIFQRFSFCFLAWYSA